jgi:hypothetical protein
MTDAGPYKIQFSNYSNVPFTLSRLDGDPLPDSAGWVTRPGASLEALDGSQEAEVSETDTIEETDFAVIWLGGGLRFGVRMHIPGQFIPPVLPTMGTAPYYYVGQDTDTSPDAPTFSTWTQAADPSDPYAWPDTPGVSIKLTATAGKSSLSLDVVVTNPTQG